MKSASPFLSSLTRKTDNTCLMCNGAIGPKDKQQMLGQRGWMRFKGDAETLASIDIQIHDSKHRLQKFLEELKMRKKHLDIYIKHVVLSLLATVVATLITTAPLISADKKFPLVQESRMKFLPEKHVQQETFLNENATVLSATVSATVMMACTMKAASDGVLF